MYICLVLPAFYTFIAVIFYTLNVVDTLLVKMPFLLNTKLSYTKYKAE